MADEMPVNYYYQAPGGTEPGKLVVGASPNTPYGYSQIDLATAQNLLRNSTPYSDQNAYNQAYTTQGINKDTQGAFAKSGLVYSTLGGYKGTYQDILNNNVGQSGMLAQGLNGTSYVPVAQEQQMQQQQADIASGKVQNIGTAQAPLTVPNGTPSPQQANATFQQLQPQQQVQQQPQQQAQQPQAGQGGQISNLYSQVAPGQTSPQVKQLQQALINAGYNIPAGATGFYGPQTQAAVDQWKSGGQQNQQNQQNQQTQQQNTPTNPILDQTTKDLAALGITMPTPDQNPTKTLTDMYTQIYAQMGLTDIKNSYTDYIKQQSDLTNKQNAEIQDVQDNPWQTQGVKDRNIAQINKSYQSRQDTLTKQITLMDNLYKEGQAQAQTIAGQVITSIHDQQTLDQNIFDKIYASVEAKSTAASWGTPYNTATGAVYQKNNTTGELRQISSAASVNNINISSGLSDAIGAGLISPSAITRGNLPILNSLYGNSKFANFDANDANARAKALNTLQTQQAQVAAFEATASKNLDLVSTLSSGVSRTGSPIINAWILAGKKNVLGDTNIAKFDTALRGAINEYAKVISGATGNSTTSDSARNEINDLLTKASTPEQVKGVINTMKSEMDNRMSSLKDEINILKQSPNQSAIPGLIPGNTYFNNADGKYYKINPDGKTGTLIK